MVGVLKKQKKEKSEQVEHVESDEAAIASEGVVLEVAPWDDDADPEATLDALERAFRDDVKRLELYCAEAERVSNIAKRDAKLAKDKFDAAVDALRARIREGVSLQPMLPGMDGEDEDEAWKLAPISSVLELTPKQLDKLLDAGIRTAGDFERVRGGGDPDYPRGLASINGVGQATIDNWEEDILEWFDANRKAEPVSSGDDAE